ncbi:MAG: hypothetical protein AMXMBFR58_30410 [Phycisphaerae bacterium]
MSVMERTSPADQATSRVQRKREHCSLGEGRDQNDHARRATGRFSPVRLRLTRISPSGALLASILLLMVTGYFIAVRHNARVGILDVVFVLSLLTFLLLAISQLAQSAKASITLWQQPFGQGQREHHVRAQQQEHGRHGRRAPDRE